MPELARLRLTKPLPVDKVAAFLLAIEDFVIPVVAANNRTMSNHWTLPTRYRRWQSLGLSLLVHSLLVIFLTLAWKFYSPQVQFEDHILRRASIVLTMNDDLENLHYLAETDSLDNLPNDSPASPAKSQFESLPTTAEVREPTHSPGIVPMDSLVFDANQMTIVPADPRTRLEHDLSPDDVKLIESDRRLLKSRAPVGEPATIGIFGSDNLTGREFVFVLDRSQSMGSGGLGVIQASRAELTDAIGQLKPHHRFQIVAYHNRTATLLTGNLLAATDKNKNAVPEFIEKLSAFGGTHHENGLIAALVFHPDVIVLMTDGGYPELHDGKLQMIRRLAGDRTQIHCIQFGAGPLQKRQNFMTRLAEQNGGSFQYIDVNQWTKTP